MKYFPAHYYGKYYPKVPVTTNKMWNEWLTKNPRHTRRIDIQGTDLVYFWNEGIFPSYSSYYTLREIIGEDVKLSVGQQGE